MKTIRNCICKKIFLAGSETINWGDRPASRRPKLIYTQTTHQAGQDPVGISGDRKIERAAQVDSLEVRGRDAPEVQRLNNISTDYLDPVNGTLHMHRVPCHHGVGERRR